MARIIEDCLQHVDNLFDLVLLASRRSRQLANGAEARVDWENDKVRSSSLLEDAQFQPFAGVYQTYMLPNSNPDINIRLDELLQTIKAVYASTYHI